MLDEETHRLLLKVLLIKALLALIHIQSQTKNKLYNIFIYIGVIQSRK